jgi:hypothetical protein
MCRHRVEAFEATWFDVLIESGPTIESRQTLGSCARSRHVTHGRGSIESMAPSRVNDLLLNTILKYDNLPRRSCAPACPGVGEAHVTFGGPTLRTCMPGVTRADKHTYTNPCLHDSHHESCSSLHSSLTREGPPPGIIIVTEEHYIYCFHLVFFFRSTILG